MSLKFLIQKSLIFLISENRSTSRPEHPYSKYGIGNIDTLKHEPEKLGLDVRDELIKFHEKYYSSNLMTLCILSNQSLEELESFAIEMFSEIPNKQLKSPEFEENPYKKTEQIEIMHVIPVQEKRELEISWPIPDLKKFYKASPSSYLTHLIGHEGKGSLLSKLKKNSWCNTISVGNKDTPTGFDFFQISAELTEEGKTFLNSKIVFRFV